VNVFVVNTAAAADDDDGLSWQRRSSSEAMYHQAENREAVA